MNYKKMLLTILFTVTTSIWLIAKDTNSTTSPKDTIFTINKKTFTKKDFPKAYQKLSKKEQEDFISQYLYNRLLLNPLTKEQKRYQPQIKEALVQKHQELKRKGIKLDELQEILFNQRVKINTIIYYEALKQHKDIKKQVQDFYQKNKKGFYFPNRVEIAHIVLKDKNSSKKILKDLEQNSSIEFFAKLAKENSLDKASKNSGGYIGDISKKSVGKEFFDNVLSGKEHSVLPKVLKHNDYYHIIYIFKKYKAEQHTLEDEKQNIIEYFLKPDMRRLKNNIMKNAKKETKIKFYDVNLTFNNK